MTFQDFIKEWHDSKAFITVKTSGSTGVPKTIHLSKTFVRESASRTIGFFNLNKNSHLHSCVSPDYIGGKMMAVRASIINAEFTSENPSNDALAEFHREDEIDLLAVVPSQMLSLIDRYDELPKIRNIIIGGSAIHPDLRRKIHEMGFNAYETYGMTETASHIALRKISEENLPFKILEGIKIDTDPEQCLIIRFRDGYEVRTNDIVDLISEKEFYVKGRRDNVIISGGRKINPEELEEKLRSVISGEFYLTGMSDKKWGEKLVLIIEGEESDYDEFSLREKFKKLVENWQIPKEIKFCRQLQRTSNGKIKRSKII